MPAHPRKKAEADKPVEDLPPADPDKLAKESTPIGDSVLADAPHMADSYDEDVQQALNRSTQDGKGDEDPGESDWNGYATEGVEVEEHQ